MRLHVCPGCVWVLLKAAVDDGAPVAEHALVAVHGDVHDLGCNRRRVLHEGSTPHNAERPHVTRHVKYDDTSSILPAEPKGPSVTANIQVECGILYPCWCKLWLPLLLLFSCPAAGFRPPAPYCTYSNKAALVPHLHSSSAPGICIQHLHLAAQLSAADNCEFVRLPVLTCSMMMEFTIPIPIRVRYRYEYKQEIRVPYSDLISSHQQISSRFETHIVATRSAMYGSR